MQQQPQTPLGPPPVIQAPKLLDDEVQAPKKQRTGISKDF
jgi:hypothetical protein